MAVRQVASRLPSLDPLPRNALALVTLAGRTRAEAAARLEVGAEELAAALAAARKELRRSLAPMAASGWCERAELLISDRLDGELDELGAARLDVHLRNCPRCVEHERRLVQALDGLVTGLAGEAELEPAPGDAPPAPLRLAKPRTEREPAPSLHRPPIASAPFGVPVAPRQRIEPPAEPPSQPPVEPPQPAPAPTEPDVQPPEPAVEPPQPDVEPPGPAVEPREPPIEPPGAVASRVLPAEAEKDALSEPALAAALEPVRRSARQLVVTGTWHLMFALAVVLAIATIAIAVWGALGGEL